MNSDGSHSKSLGSSSCGGIIRDETRAFVKGFTRKLQSCNALYAEMSGLLHGIKLALSLALEKVILELLSTVIAYFFEKGYTNYSSIKPLFEKAIHLVRSHHWTTQIAVSSREANKCADMLADRGHHSSFFVSFIERKFPLHTILINDDAGGSCPLSIIS